MRILEILSGLDGGGVGRIVYNYCSRMTNDIQFDFVLPTKEEGILEKPLKDLGCNIYHISQISKSMKRHNDELKKILIDNHYDIIHDHTGYKAWCNLSVAKKCGVAVRIAHSHTTFVEETFKEKVIRIISTPITKIYSTELFACGNDAAKGTWGKNALKSGKVYIMKNAINAYKYSFQQEKRELIRNKYNIKNKFVIGNVARFTYEKNHEFLVNIFAQVKRIREDALLMLIGRGELENQVKAQVENLGLTDSVIFMGIRDDVHDLLNAMDVFVLPSLFEGEPVCLIEIQANGLPAVISANVTKEITMQKDFVFIPLTQPLNEWVKAIIQMKRNESKNFIVNTNYDLNVTINEMKSKYFTMAQVKSR